MQVLGTEYKDKHTVFQSLASLNIKQRTTHHDAGGLLIDLNSVCYPANRIKTEPEKLIQNFQSKLKRMRSIILKTFFLFLTPWHSVCMNLKCV